MTQSKIIKLEELEKKRYLRKRNAIIKKHKRKRFIVNIISFVFISITIFMIIDFLRFPECYITTWKYQMENEIKSGNQEMIDYYNNTYVANDRILFDEVK